jgi:integrase
LQWTQVDLVRRVAWIHPDQAKARRAIPVPLNRDAALLLRQRLGKHPMYVFSYHGKRITQVSTKAWYAALEKAGIEDFRWHDLRHTWASWHVQSGTPLFALQEMGGWSSAEMVRRYAHLAADHLSPYAEKLCRPGRCARNFGHKLVTVVKNEGLASLQALELLVAGTGFEPVTFGL